MPYEPTVYHLWPDLAEAWTIFVSLRTQWRIGGMGGATGLDYGAVIRHLLEGCRLSRRRFDRIYPLLLAAEEGALAGWGEQRKEDKP